MVSWEEKIDYAVLLTGGNSLKNQRRYLKHCKTTTCSTTISYNEKMFLNLWHQETFRNFYPIQIYWLPVKHWIQYPKIDKIWFEPKQKRNLALFSFLFYKSKFLIFCHWMITQLKAYYTQRFGTSSMNSTKLVWWK